MVSSESSTGVGRCCDAGLLASTCEHYLAKAPVRRAGPRGSDLGLLAGKAFAWRWGPPRQGVRRRMTQEDHRGSRAFMFGRFARL